ncbi:MAG: DUF5010 domain-containing protein [Bacteroides sp.]|nr:DUF5010 domain-containing protein [Bacteroides sp.]
MKRVLGIGFWVMTLFIASCSSGDDDATITTPEVDPEQQEPQQPEPEETTKAGDDIAEHDFLMGSLFSFQKNLRNGVDAHNGGTTSTTFYNKPLFEAKDFAATNEEWWDNLVEEFVYSGLDYVAANCRGRLPKADTDSKYELDHGDPIRIKDLIAALKRRGEENLKIAIFDDCPASWAAARNFDLYGKYTSVLSSAHQKELNLTDEQMRYPVENLDDVYKYIWDYNIKLAFANFYGENKENNKYLLRYNGKPVLYLWSINGFLNVNYAALGNQKPDCTGKLKAILEKIRSDFQATFGEDVFFCVDRAFMDRDPQVDRNVVDSKNNWFVASEQTTNRYSYTLTAMNNVNVGVAVPGFLTNDKLGNRMLFDANHGKTLTDALDYMVKYKANLILLEGFTDMAENAAFWRSTDTKYYDYPNQRLNIVRKYSSKQAYPQKLRVEVEACDYVNDKTSGNSGKQYRVGDLDIKKCTDGYDGWCVTNTEAGEWMKWVELPFSAGKSSVKLRYASQADAKVRLDVNGKEGSEVTLAATGGAWKEMNIASVEFERKGWREVILQIIAGNADLNCMIIEVENK